MGRGKDRRGYVYTLLEEGACREGEADRGFVTVEITSMTALLSIERKLPSSTCRLHRWRGPSPPCPVVGATKRRRRHETR